MLTSSQGGYVGRFAPSPTGPLHAGSLVAALASYLDARAHHGTWLIRIEDIDEGRSVPGAAEEILDLLHRLGMDSDREVVWQSRRKQLYEAAYDSLAGHAYPCGCNRREIVDSRLGVADKAVRDFLDGDAASGAVRSHGALTVRVIPFVPQPDYDRLLWCCDLNFVRGEDSWVRAQWACKPFVWHIYSQDENLHHKKLRAFLQRYAGGNASLPEFSLAWNGASENHDWNSLWPALMADLPTLTQRAVDWQQQMRSHGDLATNLLEFARSLQYA